MAGIVAVTAAMALPAPAALANGGAGLYAPFPTPSHLRPTQQYLAAFGRDTSVARIRAGVAFGSFARTADVESGGPSARAGFGAGSTATGLFLAGAVALVAIGSIVVWFRPR